MTSARDRVLLGGSISGRGLGALGVFAVLSWADWLCVSVCVALPAICLVACAFQCIHSVYPPAVFAKTSSWQQALGSCWQVTTCIDSERLTMRNKST